MQKNLLSLVNNAEVYLPANISVKDVFTVLLKVSGYETKKRGNLTRSGYKINTETDTFYDESMPSSSLNSWNIFLPHDDKTKIISKDIESYDFNFFPVMHSNTVTRNIVSSFFGQNQYETGNKILKLNSCPLECAMGKRLVDFFGGKICYENNHTNSPNNWYTNDSPKYNTQLANSEKYYLYQNLINQEKILSSDEIISIKQVVIYKGADNDTIEKLKLRELEEFNYKLEHNLQHKPIGSRIKI